MNWQGKKVGILGGGQLGAMLIRSAIDFGLRVAVLDKNPDASCARFTGSFTTGDPQSYDDVLAFGRGVDVLTIEMEAVNVAALRQLEAEGVTVLPSPEMIGMIQNKWSQKQALLAAGIPVVPGIYIENRAALLQHSDKLPGCLKRCTDGYDGKGVMMVRNNTDMADAFDAASVLEEQVDIAAEIAVIVSRNADGAVACYDPVKMVFDPERFVLDYQTCPAGISPQHAENAMALAVRTAEAIGLIGILAVEMFITADDRLLVNELAPRPHNSGHHTIEACTTSQYEQHLRAILNLPPGDTTMILPSLMLNMLEPARTPDGDPWSDMQRILAVPGVHMHWYGKERGQEGRKMGHITITGATIDDAIEKARTVRRKLQPGSAPA